MADIGILVAQYIKLRDHIELANKEFKEGLERPKKAMEILEGKLLEELEAQNVDSFKTPAGTAYRKRVVSATVEDQQAFMDFVLNGEHLDALDVKANKTFVKEMMDQTGEVPPGVKVTQIYDVGIRRK